MIDTRNVQALLLKATLLKSLNKTNEALLHYREAIRLAPCYFEAYEGLVECYLSTEQHREALTIARNAHKTIGATARTLTIASLTSYLRENEPENLQNGDLHLAQIPNFMMGYLENHIELYAKVLFKDPPTKEKAKTVIEKALSQDSSHLPAVYLLVDILFEEKNFEKAIKVLRKQLELQRTSRLHQLLGDSLKESNSIQEALEQYNKALILNPNDVKAMDGIHSVERTAAASSDFDLSTLGMPPEQSFHNESVDEMIENESLPDDDMHWLHQ